MKLLLTSLLTISLFFQTLPVYATNELPPELVQMKEKTLAKLPSDSLLLCKEGLVKVYDVEILDFMKWLEQHFQSKSSTSSLVNTAITKYAEFEQKLRTAFASVSPKYSPDQGVQTYDEQYKSYQLCASITDSYLALAKEHMKNQIKANVAQKKTIMLIEKYQNINSKLRDLNVKVAELYSLFVTFANKLPFFTKNCQ